MIFFNTLIQFIVSNIHALGHWFSPGRSRILLFSLVVSSTVLFSALSLVRHGHFQSGGFDLGIYDQAVWHYSRLYFPYNTIKQDFILGDHFTLTLPLLAPLYVIWDDVRALLIFQAAWISLSAVPVYAYLLKRGLSPLESLILTFLYLFFYGIQSAVFFDFHPVIIGVGLAAFLLYLWEEERWRLFIVTAALLLLTQENMGFVLTGLSAIWFFGNKNRKAAAFLGICGLASSFYLFQVSDALSRLPAQYSPDFPDTIPDYVAQLADTAEKKKVWLYSYAWFLFLPVLSIGSTMAVVFNLSQFFVTGEQYSRMWGIATHHRAILSVFLTAGAGSTLLFLKKRGLKPLIILIPMLVAALFQQYYFHLPLNKLSKQSFWHEPSWIHDNRMVLATIEYEDSVAAQQSLVPHLSHREEIYLVYPHEKNATDVPGCPAKTCWWLDFAGAPDYLVVDVHPGVWLTMTLANEKDFAEALANMEHAGYIQLVYSQGDARKYQILH